MSVERLAKRLTDLGFSEEEAAVYVFLSAGGPTPARVVARRFGYNRMRAYRSLKELEERGLAQRVMGRPVRFAASPIKDVLEKHIDGLRTRLADIANGEESIIEEWERLADAGRAPEEEPRFRIHQGRQQVFDNLLQMFERSTREIRLVTTVPDLARLSLWGMDERLEQLRRRGRRIRVLTEIRWESLPDVEGYLSSSEVRHVDLPSPVRFAIIDESEALTTVSMDDSMSMTTQGDTGMWTNAASYVTAMRTFYDAVWSLSTEAEPLMRSIRTGRPVEEIRVINTREEYNTLYRDMLQRGTLSVEILTQDLRRLPASTSALTSLSDAGVRVRLMTRIREENMDEMIATVGGMDTRDAAGETRLELLIVDGAESLLNLPLAEGAERSIYSNMPAYVETMAQVYTDHWLHGEPFREKLQRHIEARRLPELLSRVTESLRREGWSAERGVYVGSSGMRHGFDLVIRDPEEQGKPLLLSVAPSTGAFNRIIELGASILDLSDARLIMATLTPLREEEVKLADLYGITTIYAATTEKLAEGIINGIFTGQ